MLRVPLLDALALFQARVQFHDSDAVDNLPAFATVLVARVADERPDIVSVVPVAANVAAAGRGFAAGAGCTGACVWSRRRRYGDWSRGEAGVDVAGTFSLHFFVGCDCGTELCGRRVDGREGEYVQEKDTAVVEEMSDSAAGKGEFRIGEDRDYAHAVHAVDIRDDLGNEAREISAFLFQPHTPIDPQIKQLSKQGGYIYPLHCKIPIFIHESLVTNCEQRDVPRLDGRGSRIDWKELDIQSV